MRNFLLFLGAGLAAAVLSACNSDDDIVEFMPQPPKITLDSETAIYKVKVGKEITIAPTYENVEGAIYTWKLSNEIISTEPTLTYIFDKVNEEGYFIGLEVTTRYGSTSEELKVEVAKLAPPVISLVVPSTGLDVVAGKKYMLAPDIQNAENTAYVWKVNDKEVGTDKDYEFCEQELGTYTVSLYAENEDGNATKTFRINVVDKISVQIAFPAPMYKLYDERIVKYVPEGRTIMLRPYIFNGNKPRYQWKLDGIALQGATDPLYAFTPDARGEYRLSLTVTDTDAEDDETTRQITRNVTRAAEYETTIEVTVVCTAREGSNYRPSTEGSSPKITAVHEYLAAPGQFVDEHVTTTSMSGANKEAQAILTQGGYVTLGGFGGYLIVGFDHSIDNIEGQYNFSVTGNQFEGSSEPGIVWVSQDTNGNGLPDDEWYELKHSEYGQECTKQFYAVTYYRPEGVQMDVPWKDNCGGSGCVDYLIAFHKQDYYYPNWVKENSYTLYGTCLEARNYQDDDLAAENGSAEYWVNPSYDWGYVDNCGSDRIKPMLTGFRISNAVNLDGTPANLKYIDFVKVVNGLNTKSGWLGEVSTEVCGFNDENINPTEPEL